VSDRASDREPGPPRGPIRVIVNPSAGSKGGIRTNAVTKADIESVLQEVGIAAEILESGSPDEARRLAAEAAEQRYAAVVAAGGDGTIGVVATELLRSSTALGVLPAGSIMNIPRMLGIPRDLITGAAVLACGVVRTIDVGEARSRPFFEAGSVGLNAAMFREAQRFESGDRASIARAIWVAFRYRPARMKIELDDRAVLTRALAVTVANGPYTGTAMTVAPEAQLEDGRFDVKIFEHFSKWELLRHFASIAFGRRQYVPHLSTYRSAFVRISSVHPLPARADSRDLGTTPVEFRVSPRALRVIVPVDGLPSETPESSGS
jgi:YegS/Rv2252/BmrU family lipid kinase